MNSENGILIFLKPNCDLHSLSELVEKITVVSLPIDKNDVDGISIQNLSTIILSGLGSYFELLQKQGIFDMFSHTILENIKSKILRLNFDILNLKNNVQIPSLVSLLPSIIQNAIASESDLGLIDDAELINKLQKDINEWIRSVNYVINQEEDQPVDSISDEISFWSTKKKVLTNIKSQMESPETAMVAQILQNNKRTHTAIALTSTTVLKTALKKASNYSDFLNNLYEDSILAATTITELQSATELWFENFKKLKSLKYAPQRAICLLQLLLKDFEIKAIEILTKTNLITTEGSEFDLIYNSINTQMIMIDSDVRASINLIREELRKQNNVFVPIKIKTPDHITATLNTLKELRIMNEDLQLTIATMLNAESSFEDLYSFKEIEKEVQNSYDWLQSLDFHELFYQSSYATSIQAAYTKKVTAIEEKLAETLRLLLSSAKNDPDALFASFKKFSSIMTKPHIRLLLHDFVNILFIAAEEELKNIEIQCQALSKLENLLSVKGIPNFSSKLYLLQEIVLSVQNLTAHLETVLSKDWPSYPEGKMFSVKLNNILGGIKVDNLVAEWVQKMNQHVTSLTFNSSLLKCDFSLEGIESFHVTKINNDMQLWREIGCLEQLCLKIPGHIKSYAKKLELLYLTSISMQEALDHFFGGIEEMPNLGMFSLLAKEKQDDIFQILHQLMSYTWLDVLRCEESGISSRDTSILMVLETFYDSVFELSNNIHFLLANHEKFNSLLDQLKHCVYNEIEIANVVRKIQACIEQVSDKKLSNYESFLDSINQEVFDTLSAKCQEELNTYIETDLYDELFHKTHQLHFENSNIIVSPNLHETKETCINMLNNIVLVYRSQNPISLVNYSPKSTHLYATNIIDLQLQTVYQNCLNYIMSNFYSAQQFVQKWQQLQILWGVDLKQLETTNEISLKKWLTFVHDLAKLRQNLDLSQSFRKFGPFRIEYEQVQYLAFNQFNIFETHLTYQFGKVFKNELDKLVKKISCLRLLSDRTKFDINNDNSVILSISNLYKCQALLDENTNTIQHLEDSFQILSRSPHFVKEEYNDYDLFQKELKLLKDFIETNSVYLKTNIDFIASLVSQQAELLNEQLRVTKKAWEEEKPMYDTTVHTTMLILEKYSTIFNELDQTTNRIKNVCALTNTPCNIDLSKQLQEINKLKHIWKLVLKTQNLISSVRSEEWKNCSLDKIKQSLEAEIVNYSNLSNEVKNYPALSHTIQSISRILKEYPLWTSIFDANLDDMHWAELFEALTIKSFPSILTIGDVCDLNLLENEKIVKTIISKAQAEKLIEQSILEIQTFWETKKPEVYSQTTGLDLLTGWESILTKIDDDLSILDSISASAHFNKFCNKLKLLQTKLQNLSLTLSMLYEIQKNWVYLLGVFDNKDELSKLMPLEVSRFETVSHELQNLISSVVQGGLIFGVIDIPDIDLTTKRIHKFLTTIKSALIGYLDKQRQKFPRFYFMGNDDLLELIGNPLDILVINKHIKKLYAGIMMVTYDERTMLITSVISSEGEVVELSNPVSLAQNCELLSWLCSLDISLKNALMNQVNCLYKLIKESDFSIDTATLTQLVNNYSDDAFFIAFQLFWTLEIESNILRGEYDHSASKVANFLNCLITITKEDLTPLLRLKVENLIIETIHKIDVIQQLMLDKCKTCDNSTWFLEQKFYFVLDNESKITDIRVVQGNYSTNYAFEYLGVVRKLAYTPLMISTYALLSEAMEQGLGGLLLGPAGTGKTESVKHLGHSFGRLVIVFCCDDTFDYESVSRIMMGIAKIGGWGCFDEFNRLDADVLSGITTQIEKIQTELMDLKHMNRLLGDTAQIHENTGIFLTNNPSYDGRSTLPDNLKSRFLSYNLMVPDLEIIANAIFASQGFSCPQNLASLLVDFFSSMEKRCSIQKHYDFGLRAFKLVVTHCGKLNRKYGSQTISEVDILCQGVIDVVLPRLTSSDEVIFYEEINKMNNKIRSLHATESFGNEIVKVAKERGLMPTAEWISKAEQIYQITSLNQGTIMVGKASVGKSTIFDCVIEAISRIHLSQNEVHRIDAKTLSKEAIFGQLDYATREWRDGILCTILRNAIEVNDTKQIWLVFDGDIDPKWVENMNSLLDDNKILTLPNGERIPLRKNVHIFFEIDSLQHTTLATISRCGIVLLNKSYYTVADIMNKLMHDSRELKFLDEDNVNRKLILSGYSVDDIKNSMLNSVSGVLDQTTLNDLWELALCFKSVINTSIFKAVNNFKTLTCSNLSTLVSYIKNGKDIDLDTIHVYFEKNIPLNLIWSFASELSFDDRVVFISKMLNFSKIKTICGAISPLDLMYSYVQLPDFEYCNWNCEVKPLTIQPHMVLSADVIIPTVDTMIYENLLFSVLGQSMPLILCGPPGSGKTMLLLKLIRESTRFELLSLNFSKETTIRSLIRAIEQCCQYRKNVDSYILSPKIPGKSLVVFCDELNLPKCDDYGTQTVIQFLRQLVSQKGFWHPIEHLWVTLRNVQFVGACNPVSTFGRINMSERFTDICYTIMIDYPSPDSLKTIYKTYCKAVLKMIPDLVDYYEPLCDSMISVYFRFKEKHLLTDKPHYICSPRELTRWIRGIFVGLKSKITMSLPGLLRLWAYEGLRLFSDRLITPTEKAWVHSILIETSNTFFPNLNTEDAFRSPILFSDWLSLDYQSTDEQQLTEFVRERFNVFSQEETNLEIILYDELLDHLLRIDRIFKNVQGHMILIGPNGSGKTTLAKFVSWMNGISIFQLNVKRDYTLTEFENCLKDLLKRAAVKGEKTCFIIDESTILENSFLEKMNTLLANAEVPGLYEGEEFDELMALCLRTAQSEGLTLNSRDEIYHWFVDRTAKNLHVIFTMSDPYSSKLKPFIASSALFNRCVINWMGPWSEAATKSVTMELTKQLPLDDSEYRMTMEEGGDVGLRKTVVDILTHVHRTVMDVTHLPLAPTQIILLIKTFKSLFIERETKLSTLNSHIHKGLDHLKETFLKVKRLEKVLSEKETALKVEDGKAKKLLDKMITDQNESERKQDMSIKMQELFAQQENAIIKRRKEVMFELQEVEELIQEAQRGVLNIKKQHLTELRSMQNPPETIKLVLESICVMLGFKVSTWRDVQHVIRQDDFIASIINFNSEEQVTKELIEHMTNTYLARDNFNYESANRASKACGPLLMWVQAQLKFSSIVVKVKPLKKELKRLENDLLDTKAKLIAINSMIDDLKEEIENYKNQYSETIRVKENIKIEMEQVSRKLNRSVKLMKSLKSERERWEMNVQEYEEHKQWLIGDSILLAAFTTYCGMLLPSSRKEVMDIWKGILEQNNIHFDPSISWLHMPGIVATDSIIKWQKLGLPHDEQFIGNTAILTSQFKARFSFIIDPSDTFIEFVAKLIAPKQLVISSFLDPEFYKKLENCLKFGGTIAIQDGEHYDPILNRLIAKDYYTLGVGRMVVRLNDKEIDMSPDFQLYICTKDPNVEIPPFVFSRMDVINYTYTTESMVNEALNIALQMREPDVDAKRLELVNTVNDWKLQLRNYETELLQLLSASEDTILDNDELLTKLEVVKEKTILLEEQMVESDKMMRAYSDVRDVFAPLAVNYARVQKLINSLEKLHKFYLYPIGYLRDIYKKCLAEHPVSSVDDLQRAFTAAVFKTTAVSLSLKDRLVLRSALNMIVPMGDVTELGVEETIRANTCIILRSGVGQDMTMKVKEFADSEDVRVSNFALGARDGHATASRMIKSGLGEPLWVVIENIETSCEFLEIVPDLLKSLAADERHADFKLIMTCGIDSTIPPLIVKSCKQILVDREVSLKRCLEEQLVAESSSMSISRLVKCRPKEVLKVMFAVVWLYALIVSRLRYVNFGFSKRYEVNEHDLRSAGKFVIECFRGHTARSGVSRVSGVSGELLHSIGVFVSRLIFGGKIEEARDAAVVEECARRLFTVDMFGDAFNVLCMCEDGESGELAGPVGYERVEYVRWIADVPDPEPVAWLGLPSEAAGAVEVDETEVSDVARSLLNV